jgi:hypothetical protein
VFDTSVVTRRKEGVVFLSSVSWTASCVYVCVCLLEKSNERKTMSGDQFFCASHKDSIPLCGGRSFSCFLPYGFIRPSQDLMKGLFTLW